jgi:hypothetical protein
MIPSEVSAIADLIWPHWRDCLASDDCEDRAAGTDVLDGAWRIYNAGYRIPDPVKSPGGPDHG